jgi:uncharacterized protein YciI
VLYVVHGVDQPSVDEQLDRLAESHWAYLDAYADRLVARGPTLSADGEVHTGSIHVVEADSIEDAQRFAFDEPYWLAGLYASVTVTRLQPALDGTMWDRPRPAPGATSSLVLVDWPEGPADAQVARRLAGIELLVFGGLLISDDGTRSSGLVAAVDAAPDEAGRLVASVAGPASTSVTSCRWRRGGRNQV